VLTELHQRQGRSPARLKENVIVALDSAGTGMEYYRNVRLSPEMEEAASKVQEEVSQDTKMPSALSNSCARGRDRRAGRRVNGTNSDRGRRESPLIS